MPRSPSATTVLLRLFSGLAGGLIGMVFALLALFLFSLAPLSNSEIEIPYSLVSILIIVFMGTITSNLTVAFLLGTLERNKYQNRRKITFQVFLFTFVLFLLVIPFYLFAADSVPGTAGIHFLFSALLTGLLCEIMSGRQYVLTGLMGVIFSGCFLIGIFTFLFRISPSDSLILIFALPLAWIFIPLGIVLVEGVHGLWYKLYGTAPLIPDENGRME